MKDLCPICNGSGKIIMINGKDTGEKCILCKGTGKFENKLKNSTPIEIKPIIFKNKNGEILGKDYIL